MRRKRKNLFFTLILTIISWGAWFYIFLNIPPESDLALLFFQAILFLALFFTLSLILGNSRSGLLLAGGIIIYLLLRLMEMDNFLNLILLASFLLTLKAYFHKR